MSKNIQKSLRKDTSIKTTSKKKTPLKSSRSLKKRKKNSSKKLSLIAIIALVFISVLAFLFAGKETDGVEKNQVAQNNALAKESKPSKTSDAKHNTVNEEKQSKTQAAEILALKQKYNQSKALSKEVFTLKINAENQNKALTREILFLKKKYEKKSIESTQLVSERDRLKEKLKVWTNSGQQYRVIRRTNYQGIQADHPIHKNDNKPIKIKTPTQYIFECLHLLTKEKAFFIVPEADLQNYLKKVFLDLPTVSQWKKLDQRPNAKQLAEIWLEALKRGEVEEPSSMIISLVETQIAHLQKTKEAPSKALGPSTDGKLINPSEIAPEGGIGYKVVTRVGARFGLDEMVWGLMWSGGYMTEKLGTQDEHKILLGDISAIGGGKLKGHGTHQKGNTADIFLYRCDKYGKPLGRGRRNKIFFDENGYNKLDDVYFDIKRNWILLCSMAENPHYGLNSQKYVRRILFNDPLKKLLIDFAQKEIAKSTNSKEIQLYEKTITFAKEALVDFPRHNDHFHITLNMKNK